MQQWKKEKQFTSSLMSEEGWEQKYVKEAFDTNWVVPMGPNVNAFEKDLRHLPTARLTAANRSTERSYACPPEQQRFTLHSSAAA